MVVDNCHQEAVLHQSVGEWDARQWQLDRYGLEVTKVKEETGADCHVADAGHACVASVATTSLTLTKAPQLEKISPTSYSSEDDNNAASKPQVTQHTCQVDGCEVDVRQLSGYQNRYRVCDAHQKALVVLKDGRKQRFCQQCGKFHPLDEFQGQKKSCRSRLDKHNARRRRLREIQLMLRTTGTIDKEVLKEKYKIDDEELEAVTMRAMEQMSGQKKKSTMKSGKRKANRNGAVRTPKSAKALSLLKSRERSSTDSVLLQSDLSTCTDTDKDSDTTYTKPAGDSSMGMVPDIPSTDFPHGVSEIPLHALHPDAMAGMDLDLLQDSYLDDIDIDLPGLLKMTEDDKRGSAHRQDSGMLEISFNDIFGTGEIQPPNKDIAIGAPQNNVMMKGATQHCEIKPFAPVADHSFASVDDALKLMMPESHIGVKYGPGSSAYQLSNMNGKLYGSTPADLPSQLKPSMQSLMSAPALEGYMRPGCVHIQMDALLDEGLNRSELRSRVQHFVDSLECVPESIILQFESCMVVLNDGKIRQVLNMKHAGDLVPSLIDISPKAIVSPHKNDILELELVGRGIKDEDEVIARSQGRYLDVVILSSACLPNGDCKLKICVHGDIHPGSLQIEISRGPYVCQSQVLLIANTEDEVSELKEMLNPSRGILYELGTILEAKQKLLRGIPPGAVAREYKDSPSPPGLASCKQIPLALKMRWKAMLSSMLGVCTCGKSGEQVLEGLDAICMREESLTLLQFAVQAKDLDVLQIVLEWGLSCGLSMKSCTPGIKGLTALHFAALAKDGGQSAALLTKFCSDAVEGWEGAKAVDGSSPLALATRYGCRDEIEKSISRSIRNSTHYVGGSHVKKTWFRKDVEEMPSDSSSHSTSSRVLDSRMGPLLNFVDERLEKDYVNWFNRVQISIDLSFMAIAIISQAAWVLKWDFHLSVLMFASMISLMLFNCGVAGLAVFRTNKYVTLREKLCVASLLLHKCVQLIVSATPGVGTIHSTTFSPTIALLETSSFAQVAMLSVGARPRLKLFLPTLGLMLAFSSLLTGSICSAAFPATPFKVCVSFLWLYQVVAAFVAPAMGVYVWEKHNRSSYLKASAKKGKSK